MTTAKKPIIFSGIQPSGSLTLGNYIGALRNWKLLEDDYECLYSVVDLHAITVRQDPKQLKAKCLEVLGILLACGLDPNRSLIYFQSHVHEHAELQWMLSCMTYMGELSRMTQFKDKSAHTEGNINAGLLTYPVLMAADILLFQTNLVPVGADQRQHLELSRDIAIRVNNAYGKIFAVPEPYIPKVGGRVMSLLEPTRKMSKSDPEDTYIAILDEPNVIKKKIKRAVTDSLAHIAYDVENQPGVSNLLEIIGALTGKSIDEVVTAFEGKGYGALKTDATDAVIATLEPLQQRYHAIVRDRAYINDVIANSARRASEMAQVTLNYYRDAVGLAPRVF